MLPNTPYPLKNKTILITRTVRQYTATVPLVHAYQAIPQSFPCLAMESLPHAIKHGIRSLKQASDVLFTSANSVYFLQTALNDLSLPPLSTLLQHARIACVGKKTATSLQQLDIPIHLMPVVNHASQQGLVDLYNRQGIPRHLIFFRAEKGNDLLQHSLEKQGVTVTLVPTYRSLCPFAAKEEAAIREQLKQHRIDAVLLGSSRTAINYVERVNNILLANSPTVVTISTQVAEVAKSLNLQVDVIAKTPSFSQMMAALSLFYSASSSFA